MFFTIIHGCVGVGGIRGNEAWEFYKESHLLPRRYLLILALIYFASPWYGHQQLGSDPKQGYMIRSQSNSHSTGNIARLVSSIMLLQSSHSPIFKASEDGCS